MYLFLSPHFDDIALSCGALVSKLVLEGNKVIVATICGGEAASSQISKLAEKLHKSWNISDPNEVVKLRKLEDQKAMRVLGCEYIHLSIPDCIYRADINGNLIYNFENFEPVLSYTVSANDITPQQVISELSRKVKPDHTKRIFAPIGAGGHTDHILTRLVGDELFKLGHSVTFYEEIYSLETTALEKALQLSHLNFEQFFEELSKRNLEIQVEACYKYESQYPALENFYKMNMPQLAEYIFQKKYSLDRYGISLWSPQRK